MIERIYVGALCAELKATELPFEREKRYSVIYRGQVVSDQYLDLVVGNQVVIEVKSVSDLAPIHHQQILNYMRIARLRAGLLVNFNVAITARWPEPKDPVRKVSFVFFVPSPVWVSCLSWLWQCFQSLPLRLQLVERHVLHGPT